MASQMAQILNNYRQTMPEAGSGVRRGIEMGLAIRQDRRRERLVEAEEWKLKRQAFVDKYIGPIVGADAEDKWIAGQDSGFIPKGMTFDQREPFIMSALGEKAFSSMEEVADPKSQTGKKLVPSWQAVGQPAPQSDALVKIDQTQETEEAKMYGKDLVNQWTDIRTAASTSEDALAQYNMAKNIDIEQSGPTVAWQAGITALAEDLGIDVGTLGLDQTNNVYAYQGIMQNMVLSKMMAQKGPQTENDAKRIEATLATIGNPEDARKFLLDAGMAMEQMNIDERNFWSNWRTTHGSFDGAGAAWSKFRDKTPFLAKNPKTGRPVFFTQFVTQVQALNPNADYGDIVELWQKKYGGQR